MVGAATSGFASADPTLFHNSTWVLCAQPDAHPRKVEKVQALVRALGAKGTPEMTAAQHDQSVAASSHVVQVTATALAGAVGSYAEDTSINPFALAGGG